jgi:hypothetical protein
MAGDAALSARLRVAPLRSRHEGIRPNRSGRIRTDCAGPLVKTLNYMGKLVAEARLQSPSSKTLADEFGLRRTGGFPHQLCHRRAGSPANRLPVGDDWVVVIPAPTPLTPREPQPFSVRCPRASDRLSCGPGWRCALRYVGHLGGRKVPGQGLSSNSQGCPRNFPVTHRVGWFIHRSCTALPTDDSCRGLLR